MNRTTALALATVVVALLACKGKGEDKELPEVPPLPTSEGEGPATDSKPKEPSTSPAVGDEGASDAGASDKGTSDKGTSDKGTSDKGTSDKGTSDKGTSDASDAGTKEEPTTKDAGTTASPTADASVGDLQKRAEQCIKSCSAQFEKCKSVDISKLPECVQTQASCTSGCK